MLVLPEGKRHGDFLRTSRFPQKSPRFHPPLRSNQWHLSTPRDQKKQWMVAIGDRDSIYYIILGKL